MQYLSAAEAAEKWKISERSVRNYCAKGRVEGAVLKGKREDPQMWKNLSAATLKLQSANFAGDFAV